MRVDESRCAPDDAPQRQPVEQHPVMNNYAYGAHGHVRERFVEYPRFVVVHFTLTHASWMNSVEAWFGVIERQAIRRGAFKSAKVLNIKVRAFIDRWNYRSYPFVWIKTAEQALARAKRPITSNPLPWKRGPPSVASYRFTSEYLVLWPSRPWSFGLPSPLVQRFGIWPYHDGADSPGIHGVGRDSDVNASVELPDARDEVTEGTDVLVPICGIHKVRSRP